MLSCLVLNVHDIQEDIENWIVVKKIAKTIKKRLDIKEKIRSSTKSRKQLRFYSKCKRKKVQASKPRR